MRRWVEPSIAVFVVALVASLGIHLPAYEALGVLARVFDERAAEKPPPATVEFTIGEPSSSEPELPAADSEESPEEDPDSTEAPRQRPEPEETQLSEEDKTQEKPKPKEKEQKEEDETPEEAEVEVHQSPPPDPAHMHAVRQHSETPEEAPDDPRYVSEQNNRVDEETVARLRNLVRDDETPAPGPSEDESVEPSEEPGNATDDEVEQMRDMEGSDVRNPTPSESRERRPEKAPEDPPPKAVAERDGASGGERDGDSHAERSSRESRARAEPAERVTTVHDGFGTLRVPRAVEPERRSAAPGGRDDQSSRERRARQGRRGAAELGLSRRFAWSELQQLYGEEQLEQERRAYVEERRSRRRGTDHQRRWEEFRAAIENYVPNVKPGNQTALNAAASPFAAYISDVHRRIHPEFAGDFLANLPTFSASPFADTTLRTKLEIILNRDGSVHRIGVVHSSGFTPFDFGAYASVMRGQPYPEAPLSILSGDGRVYLQWGFYRNQRQCGTFNAEPYVLPNPPGTPEPGQGGLKDEPDWGGVVPDDARPSWGTEGEESGAGAEEGEEDGRAPPAQDRRAPPPSRGQDDEAEPRRQDPPPEVPPGAALG